LATNPHNYLGKDIDPEKTLTHNVNGNGEAEATYKGKSINYMEYIDIIEENTNDVASGRKIKSSIGMFSGFKFKKK